MRLGFTPALALCAALALAQSGEVPPSPTPSSEPVPGSREHLRACIEHHLGCPYVWGATGIKSFDCSGFVWRTMLENGIFLKRTTARKFFVSLRKVDEQHQWEFSNLVFFNDLEHVGIVNDKGTFFHAQCSKGTNLSSFDPFWRGKIYGFRAMPFAGLQGPPAPAPGAEPAASGEASSPTPAQPQP